ncbi:hypothetical protein SpCBS45565_g08258 [Spizellomyces sp. 'palustris']|nr:hypothetical protein SpCBS45565_g08258 [Spizellomyces sp. 'palustris']
MARLLHYAFEAVLLSTAFSGARRAAGVDFNYQRIENETLRSVVGQYLRIGDWVIDTSADQLKKTPDYFVSSKR